MGAIEERDPRFIGIERKVGVFIVIALSCIVLSVVLVGLQRELFISKANIYFIADSGTDLIVGQPVKFKGFRIGKVEKVSLNERGKVEIRLSINEEYLRFIKADSVATLSQEGVIGDNIISISEGSHGMENIYDGGGIFFERAVSVSEIANEIKKQAEQAIEEIKSITRYVDDPEGDIRQTLSNVRVLTEELKGTRHNVDELLKSTDTTVNTVHDDVIPMMLNMMDTTDSTLIELKNTLEGTMDKAEKSMDNVLKVTEEMKGAASRVPFAVEEGMGLMEDASEVMGAAKKTWPLNKHTGPEKPGNIKVDSYE
jgi:phospholipid/cholesterol/gamma-HCH transport system substrate-binding protein